MRLAGAASIAILVPATAAGQQNPFELTGGSVKSAHVVYEATAKAQQPGVPMGGPVLAEVGVTPNLWIMRMVAPVEIAGKKDTLKTMVVVSGDSQYTYLEMGPGTRDGQVVLILRRHLAREYATLNAGAKERFKQNLRLFTNSSMSGSSGSEGIEYITLMGDKKGSETIAGHKCDVYQDEESIACVLPQAPGVILRTSGKEEAMNLVAKKVTLNGPVPSVASVLPKGVRWQQQGYDAGEFAPPLWEMKKQSDPSKVPPAALAKFAVGYLASPAANAELKEMGAGDESGYSEEGAEEDQGQ